MNFDITTYIEPTNEFKGKHLLHLNENLLSANKNFLKNYRFDLTYSLNNLNEYPKSGSQFLKDNISNILQINENNIFIDNGSSNIIRKLFKRYVGVDGIVLLPYPSWGFYTNCLDFLNEDYSFYILDNKEDRGFEYNVDEIEKAIQCNNVKLLVICSPNNPTGNRLNSESIQYLIKKYTEIAFVVDQAYFGFDENKNDDEIIQLIDRKNLYIIRTMSKFYGLANLRIGFLLACKENITQLNNLSTVFGVSSISQIISSSRIKQVELDSQLRKEYSEISKYLLSCNNLLNNFKFIPSSANFFLIKINKYSDDIYDFFNDHGFIIKIEKIHEKNYIRLTISSLKVMKEFLNKLVALDKFYGF